MDTKYAQEVGLHEDHSIHFNDERYKIITTQINSNKFTDFDLKNLTWKNKNLKT